MNTGFVELKFLNQIGQTLNVEERIKLQLAILKIQENYKFDEYLFWGRVEGLEKDYYIAVALQFRGQFDFPQKKFFWSSNNFHFAELPKYKEQFAQKAESLRDPFTGQHERIVFRGDEDINLEDSLEIVQPSSKHFSELERLSFVVHKIEEDCAAVPVGGYRLTPTHEFVRGPFKGVEPKLENYQHFRPPRSQEKLDLIARDEALFNYKFLDPLTEDKPHQSWSIQQDSTKRNTTVRSLLWPGFVAYSDHFIFGYAYFGDGVKNSDFEFLL